MPASTGAGQPGVPGDPGNPLFPLILDSINEGVFTVDEVFRITSFNREAERISGVQRENAIGKRCYDVFHSSLCESGCAMMQTLRTGKSLRDVRVDIVNASRRIVPISVSTALLKDELGRMKGGVEILSDISDVESLRHDLSGQHGLADIIGVSPAMREVFQVLPDVAACDASVLVQGESGTGKELVARAVHDLSPRKGGPFVRVNCAALPDTLLESELFGYVKGAFTDARRDKPGRFALADGGTILLDEIGDVSPAFQVKLLRALQEGEVQPLGSTGTLKLNVRVIAATNRDLSAMAQEGTFREDLYYRIQVVPLTLPPLRERRQDIPLLVDHFLKRFAIKTGKHICEVSAPAMRALLAHPFPGNVRELENVIERAFVLCHGPRIELSHVLLEKNGPVRDRQSPEPRLPGAPPPPVEDLPLPVDPAAAKLFHALETHHWRREETAKELRISRNTLWCRMKRHGLLAPETR